MFFLKTGCWMFSGHCGLSSQCGPNQSAPSATLSAAWAAAFLTVVRASSIRFRGSGTQARSSSEVPASKWGLRKGNNAAAQPENAGPQWTPETAGPYSSLTPASLNNGQRPQYVPAWKAQSHSGETGTGTKRPERILIWMLM